MNERKINKKKKCRKLKSKLQYKKEKIRNAMEIDLRLNIYKFFLS